MATSTRKRISLPVLPARSTAAAVGADPGGPRVALVTLGCDKNTVDSERILGALLGAGVAVAPDAASADVVVVNTCGFIEAAREESIETLLEAARLKDDGRVAAVVAIGCLVQRHKDELAAELPEVDLFLGLTETDRLLPELRRRGLLAESVPNMERPLRALASAHRHSSFLKISEGCDHTCAFCAIPLMRGRFRSTPIDVLVREATELEVRGVVELNIVSQDTTWYGRDWRNGIPADDGGYFIGRPFDRLAGPRPAARGAAGAAGPLHGWRPPRGGALPALLEALLEGTAIPWLRLFYMYPSGITPELVALMAREPRIVPYLDMPIQHGSDAVLRRMRRPERARTIRERVAALREAIPHVALRTTVIVGFPGESEEDFEAMLDLLEEIRFDHLGAFPYSPEAGTPAAEMSDPVPEAERRERLERLLEIQRGISLAANEAWIGRETTVLVDRAAGADGTPAVGRTRAQAPEVDGVVEITGAAQARPGDRLRVRVTGAGEHDLEGVVAGGSAGGEEH